MKKFFSLLMMFILAVGVGWAADAYYTLDGTEIGGTNGYATESEITQNSMTWMVTGNTQINPWRIGGKSLSSVNRTAYSTTSMGNAIGSVELEVGDATLTVNSLKLTVASDASFSNVLDEVSANFSANNTITFTPTTGTEWATGAYYKFTFNVTTSGSSNQFVQFVSATFYKPSSSGVAAPTITGTTPFKGSTEVTITAAEGAEIRYNTRGVDPDPVNPDYWVLYSEPFTITSTTTVKAVAVVNNVRSDVTSKLFEKMPSVASIDEFIASTGTVYFANPVTVIGQSSDKKNTYVQDGSNRGLLIYNGAGIEQAYGFGDVIPAGFQGSYSLYKSQHEMANATDFAESTGTATLTPLELTPSQVTDANFGRYAVIKGATISDGKIVVGTESVTMFDTRLSWTPPTDLTKKYDIYGISSQFNGGAQFMPLSYVESTEPTEFTIEITPVPTEGQVYTAPVQVTITPVDASGEVEIQYTLDGTDPSASGATVYTGPFTIEQSATVKAYAVDDDGNEATAEQAYTINIPVYPLPYSNTMAEDNGDFSIDNVNLGGLSYVWSHDNRGYYKASAYANNSAHATESWLVSPKINMGDAANPVLTFSHVGRYFADVATAKEQATLWIREVGGQWASLEIPGDYGTSSDWTFADVEINLPAEYAGKTVQLGFKYTSTDDAAGTWEVKNFKIEDVAGVADYYLSGNFNDWTGSNGEPSEDYKFNRNDDGTYTLNKPIDDNNANDDGILFKIIKVVNGTATWLGGQTQQGETSHGLNSGWHTNIPLVDGSNFHMTDGGTCTFTINADGQLTVDKAKALFIRGTFNNWAKQAMTKSGSNWTYESELAAGTQFKFSDEWGIWYGGNGTLTLGENYTLVDGGGDNITLDQANTYTFTVDANVTTLVVDGPFVTASTFKLVTSADELVAGKQYIIVGENTVDDETTTYTINTTVNTNNRRASVVESRETINGNDYIDVQNDMAVFELGGEANAWTFYDGKQKGYLQSSTANSNYLYTKVFAEGNAEATITIGDEGTNVVFNAGNRNTMRFNINVQNGTPNPLFSCYSSTSTTGKPVTLWVEAEKPEPIVEYNITIAETENGTVEADKEKAAAEAVVTLTIKPDEGFELDQLSVMCGDNAVEVSENNTFAMPAGNVTVTATFKAIDFNLTITPASGTYYKVISAAISAENLPDYASLVYVLNDGEQTAYTNPVTINSDATIVARVIGSNNNVLAEETANYTILIPVIAVDPLPGTYVDEVTVHVTVTNMPADGTIKYTLWDPEEEEFLESNEDYDDTEGIVIDQTAVLFVTVMQGNETLAYWGDQWLEDDEFQYTIITGGTLDDVLAGEDVAAINEDLHIGFTGVDDGMVYAADADGNWIGLKMNDEALAEIVASNNKVLKAGTIQGTAANLTTNPTFNVTSVPELIDGDAAQPVVVNMAANFSDIKGNTLVKIGAYYKGTYFSAFQSDYEGQMLSINNTYMNTDDLVLKQRYNVTGVLRLKGEWDNAGTNPAPRRVGVDDTNYHENMEIMPTNVDIVTGVSDMLITGEVQSVKYMNLTGMTSNEPFEGVNIVVIRYTDGTSTTAKVVF